MIGYEILYYTVLLTSVHISHFNMNNIELNWNYRPKCAKITPLDENDHDILHCTIVTILAIRSNKIAASNYESPCCPEEITFEEF